MNTDRTRNARRRNRNVSALTGISRSHGRSHFEPLEARAMMSAALPAGSVKLTGNLIGTAGSYQNKGNTIAKTVDANPNSYFDAPSGVQGWVGLDLGAPETVTQVQYVPRSGYSSRMVGGVFQGSNTIDFSAGVTTLCTVTAVPSAGTYTARTVTSTGTFQYVRYLAPAGASGNVAEVEFDGTTATIVPIIPIVPVIPNAPLAPTNLTATSVSATDVHLAWQEDPASTVSSFTIERQSPADGSYVLVGTAPATAASFDDTTALAATAYSYEILANSTGRSSPLSAPALVTTLLAPANPWTDSDIGAVGIGGSAAVNSNGTITVNGSGADIWNTADAFNFESQAMTGNGTLIAQVAAQSNPSSWAKSGIMMRENLNSDSRYVLLALTPGNGVTLQARTATHTTPTICITVPGKTGVWLELVRTGGSFSGYVSTDGMTWTLVGTVAIPMVNNVQAGLCVTAHNNTKICTATFSNVAITPAGTEASAWSAGASAPQARWESESFSYNNQLYVFGGYIDRTLDATTECDVYNPATNSWSYVATMPMGALTHASVCVVGDTAYFAGGNLGSFSNPKAGIATAAVSTYNLATGAWGSITSLPAAVTSGGLVCVNNQLIYFGGINANNTADVSSTWTLDLTNPNAAWAAAATMPNARNHIGYVAINGLAYAVGGQHLYKQTTGNDSEVDAYNPVTNTWTTVAGLPFAWSGIHNTTLAVNGKIVILGGQTNGGYDGIYLNNIEEYDPVANIWSAVGTLPEANQGQSVAYIDNQLIVANGTVDNQGGWAQNQVLIDSEIVL